MTTAQTVAEPQRLRALEHANAIRLARAALKRRIADGDTSAAAVILECPDAANRWTVSELLMSQRRWGSTRCRKFLERTGVSEIKTIGALTDRQRRLLADHLESCEAIGSRLKVNAATPVADASREPDIDASRELIFA